jgi:hypothetical protein
MSAHTITLDHPFADQRVGNSMSTNATFNGQQLTVAWKGQKQSFPAKFGSRVMIACGGGFPDVKVMTPPTNLVTRAAWENGFYAKKRFATLDKLRAAAEKVTYYSAPHGYDLDGVKIYVSSSCNCAIAYKAAMEGQVGTPWGWWANEQATADEIRNLRESARGSAWRFTAAMVPMEVRFTDVQA